MKKYILAVICVAFSTALSAQIKLETKKYKLSDLFEKTMEIVLTGNEYLDSALRDGLQDVWHISSFEFCSREQFEARKKSPEFFFLVLVDSSYTDEALKGVMNLTVFKGNPKASKGVAGLDRIATLPFMGVGCTGEKESAFLPAFVNILQQHILFIQSREFNIGSTVRVNASKALGKWDKPVLISKRDLSDSTSFTTSGASIILSDDAHAVRMMKEQAPDCLVGYVVRPAQAMDKGKCHTMVVDPQTLELYYMKERGTNRMSPGGFTYSELKEISSK